MGSKTDPPMGVSEANGIECADCADHLGIPRDGCGRPVYFILPDGVRANYERRISHCERGWNATHDPAFIVEALICTFLHRQPMTRWLFETVATVMLARRTPKQTKDALERHVQWMRFDAVRATKVDGQDWLESWSAQTTKLIADLRSKKAKPALIDAAKQRLKAFQYRLDTIRQRGHVTWPEAHQLALEAVQGTVAGERVSSPDMMGKDYKRVKADLDAGRGNRYFLPKVPREALAKVLDKHHL